MPKRARKQVVALPPAVVEGEAIRLLAIQVGSMVIGQPAGRASVALTLSLANTLAQASAYDAAQSGKLLAEMKALLDQKVLEAVIAKQMGIGDDK